MDEDAGVKAPVTRLRRRLSVEQSEESKSPAVNTPTKKRGGRKSAKPELGLIDENTPDNTTRRTTKKTATKDVVVPEDKPVTPARRSTRVRSNTSILTETALVVDSPRARRATRRASLAGSDSDAPLTPITRQTRRTRKDSASSVENEPQLPLKQGIQITEVIIEEPEVNLIKSTPQSETTTDQNNSPNNIRKSPRLLDKKKNTPVKITAEECSNDAPVTETSTNTPIKSTLTISSDPKSLSSHTTDTIDLKCEMGTSAPNHESESSQNRLSIGSAKLIKELNTEVTNKPNFNKSWSDTENKRMNSKRHRTKSASNDSQFYSDCESAKSKIKHKIKSFSPLVLRYKCGSGGGSSNTSSNQDVSIKSKRKKKDSMNFVVENIDEINNIEKGPQIEALSFDQHSTANDDSKTGKLLEKTPYGDIKTMIFIEDTDSNSEKIDSQTRHETEDQCVPVINHLEVKSFVSITDRNEPNILDKSTELSQRKDSEPMDIDETIPESLIIQSPEQTTGRKSTSIHISNLSSGDTEINKSEKSSVTQSLNKSGIETKTTLILSQIKDSSAGDEVKSPDVIKNKLLSKSVDDLNITQENEMKKNVSLQYSTSTPLQDKNIQKFKGILVNTPISATQNNDNKSTIKEVPDVSEDKCTTISKTENNESSEVVNLKEPIFAENKRKNKKSYNKEIEISNTEVKELEEKMNVDDENRSTAKDIVTVKQKNESKLEDQSFDKKFNKSLSNVKQSKKNLSCSEESEEELDSSDDSENKNNFIEGEAIDAGDDYESGDSQDESERRYEEENEVLDKGETLETDDEFSDDSDYEKDSFLVSSNEEDEDLLDGTDDDLSMSDNELKMTAKSKKKYNERKNKEQKKASREMYESRHKLNTVKKNEITKVKKNKRQQISSSESEEDIKPKKNNRLRLDSTKEASLLADKSEHKISMKKNKQLVDSNSSSCESIANEIEMTICNESLKESDPLSAQIKTEPKTPQRSTNSTIAFIDSEDVNNDQIDKNESTKTQSEFLDPLQATMVADDGESSLSSDNENIMQNYDSVLKDLNETNKIKAKVCDISLNLDSNRKKKEKTTIVDELNLTQVKSVRKPENKEKAVICRDEDEASSDSIDFHLLFSENSNNSDTSSLRSKMKAANSNSEEIIPLKRTDAKTDIRESKDEGASFFFDTVGSHADSMNNSNYLDLQKDEKQSTENVDLGMEKSVNKLINKIPNKEISDDEAPVEISYQKEKSPKRKSIAQDDIKILMDEADIMCDTNKAVLKTPNSGKKKKRQSESLSADQNDNQEIPVESNTSEKQRKKSEFNLVDNLTADNQEVPIELNSSQKKKHNKSASNSLTVDDVSLSVPDNQEVPMESKTSQKKKRNKSASNSVAEDNVSLSVPDNQEVSMESKTSQKKKRNKSASNSAAEDNVSLSVPDNQDIPMESKTSQKKKRNKSASNSFTVDDVSLSVPDNQEVSMESKTSQKKKRNKSASNSFAVDDVSLSVTDNQEVSMESKTSQKKKRNKSASNSVAEEDVASSVPDNQELPIESKTSQKKKLKKSATNSDDITPSIQVENTNIAGTSSMKRKRNPSLNTTKEDIPPTDNVEASAELKGSLVGSKKKKRKIANEEEVKIVAEAVPLAEKHEESYNKKQDKKNQSESEIQNNSKETDKRNKKRKEREDDKTSTSKTVKEIVFEKVPRLPPTLLEKLDDVPHIDRPSKKPKLASTTQFLVDDIKKRKIKPSDYLEESVYLNEESEQRRNRKKHLLKPKVLPFVPTASTSSSGFTTDFKITVLPSDITFVAQASTVNNFRESHLYGHKIRRPGTFDAYKRQRHRNLTKF